MLLNRFGQADRFQDLGGEFCVGGLVAGTADRMLNTLPGGAPSYQFRADTVTLSGGNVATIPNRRGADALVLSAGTLAAPASDALFGGAQSLLFANSQYLDSNLPASSWRFLHDDSLGGCEVFDVFAPTVTSLQCVRSTYNSTSSGIGCQLYTANSGVAECGNGSGLVYASNIAGFGSGAALYSDVAFGGQPRMVHFLKERAGYSSIGATAASASSPVNTLRLGAQGGGSFKAQMKWCETLIFTRVLSEYERQIVREYIQARYGIAAPVLNGNDRVILSMNPFTQILSSDYSTSGGKVTAFLDRARPGHTLFQASAALQVLNPTADAAYGGRVSAAFTAGPYYDSNLPASAWAHMHNDLGCDYFLLHTPKAAGSGTQYLLSTADANNAQIGMSLYGAGPATNTYTCYCVNGLGAPPPYAGDPIQASVKDVATYLEYALGTAGRFVAKKSNTTALSAFGTLPSASAPTRTLRLGARAVGANPVEMNFVELLGFRSVLSSSDRAFVRSYFNDKYGVTP